MIIIGGVGSIMGSFLGAAFIVLLPIFLDVFMLTEVFGRHQPAVRHDLNLS
jgi:branched-chain amino acid transport system permease protein